MLLQTNMTPKSLITLFFLSLPPPVLLLLLLLLLVVVVVVVVLLLLLLLLPRGQQAGPEPAEPNENDDDAPCVFFFSLWRV